MVLVRSVLLSILAKSRLTCVYQILFIFRSVCVAKALSTVLLGFSNGNYLLNVYTFMQHMHCLVESSNAHYPSHCQWLINLNSPLSLFIFWSELNKDIISCQYVRIRLRFLKQSLDCSIFYEVSYLV